MHCRIPLLSLVVALSAAACSVNAGQGGDPSPPAASSGGESETQASAALAEQPEPAPAELAAKPAEPPPPPTPTVGAMVTHPIKDFDTWKQHFDTHEGKRARAGIVGHSVGLDADRRKSVVVYFAATDLDALRQFLESPDRRDERKGAGVRSKPQVALMKHGESEMPKEPQQAAAVLSYRFKDYDAWKQAWDGQAAARAEAGIAGYSLSRNADDPKVVHVYIEGGDVETLRAYAKSRALRKAMRSGGTVGQPKTTFMAIQEMKFYPPGAADAEPEPEAPTGTATSAPSAAPAPPAKPAQPAKAATPAAPAKPTTPAKPAAPAKPATPAEAGAPAKPAAPATPAQPAKPAQPAAQ